MKRIGCFFVLLCALTGSGSVGPALGAETEAPSSEGLTAQEILDRADAVLTTYEDQTLTSTLTVIEADGTERVRELKVWEKGTMRVAKFVNPPSERGIGLLTLDSKTNYVYLPEYKRVRRVAAHMRNQTWGGTEFTHEDMSRISFGGEYTPSLLDETDTHWRLELTPKPGSDSGYGKLVISVRKERFPVERIEYFDKSGRELLKVEERSGFTLYDGKHYNASNVVVTNLRNNRRTVMINSDYRFDQGLRDDLFTERTLKLPVR
jgi:outer membrane lipoprotein-sorting protein